MFKLIRRRQATVIRSLRASLEKCAGATPREFNFHRRQKISHYEIPQNRKHGILHWTDCPAAKRKIITRDAEIVSRATITHGILRGASLHMYYVYKHTHTISPLQLNRKTPVQWGHLEMVWEGLVPFKFQLLFYPLQH